MSRKFLFRCFLLVCLFFTVMASPAAANDEDPETINLVPNPGFEEVKDGKPTIWIPYGNYSIYESSDTTVLEATYSAKLDDPSNTYATGLRTTMMPIQEGLEYEASVYAYIESGRADLYLEFWNEAGQRIDVKIQYSTLAKEWMELAVSGQAPPGAAYATLLLYLNGGNVGTVYFDQASLVERAVFSRVELYGDLSEMSVNGPRSQLHVQAYMSDGTLVDPDALGSIVYKSSDSEIAVVDEDGLVTAVGEGEAVLSAEVTVDGITIQESMVLTVIPNASSFPASLLAVNNQSEGISLVTNADHLEVKGQVGDEVTFAVPVPDAGWYELYVQGVVKPAGGIANVKLDGNLLGTYNFYQSEESLGDKPLLFSNTLTAGEHLLSFEIQGKQEASLGYDLYLKEVQLVLKKLLIVLKSVHLSLSSNTKQLPVGHVEQLHVAGVMADNHAADLTDAQMVFSSSDANVIAVDDLGFITVKQEGQAVISVQVTLHGVTQTAELILNAVPPQLTELNVETDTFVLKSGDTAQVTVTGTLSNGFPADLSEANLHYYSEDESIAAVDETGRITGRGSGGVLITAEVTLHGVTASEQVWVIVQNESLQNAKTKSTYYTAEKVANARENIGKYEWASARRDAVVASAEQYLQMDDDSLWQMVTSQEVPRSLGVALRYTQRIKGSPGPEGAEINKYGNYPWIIDPIQHPWKLKSPVTGELYPTNDFKSYYESGLDKHGKFDPALAKARGSEFLVNELYPDRGADWGVDDGSGWMDEDGDIWTFAAYYNHWGVWYNGLIMNALNTLRDAYLYTGDERYAYKGLVLLDRVADVYPEMDVTDHRWDEGFDNGDPSGHSAQGKVVNDIWETGLVKSLIFAYDAFFPAMESLEENLTGYLSEKAQHYQLDNPKHTAAAIRKNIEDNILRITYPGVKNSQIRGNMGMHQSALALAAVVLDEEGTSKEWLDFVFQSGDLQVVSDPNAPYGRRYIVTGGNMNALLVEDIDRDGMPFEAAPGYNNGWLHNFLQVAEILDGYERYPEYDLFDNVKFRKMFGAFYPLTMIGRYTPTIGDTGKTGNPGVIGALEHDILAFQRFKDPLYAQLAYMKNNQSSEGLHGDIFSENPGALAAEIEQVIAEYGPLQLDSTQSAGYGFNALRDGEAASIPDYGIQFNFRDLAIVEATLDTRYMEERGALLFRNNQGPGHSITFAFEVEESDQYEINLMPFSASSYGIYEIKIDDQQIGPYDFYNAAGGQYDAIAEMELEAGTHTITFEAIGKHEASTDYYMSVMQLALLDEDAKQQKLLTKEESRRGIWMYYGRNTGHGHKDTLNLGLHAFGLDLSPDLGYPEVTGADPKRLQWTSNTISHNTVVVDKTRQSNSYVAIPHHFDDSELVKLMDVEAPKVYPQTELYRRTTAMIQVDEHNSYAIDFFRVKGGSDHHYSFHGAEGEVSTEGLDVAPQQTGTYAGEDVPFTQPAPWDPNGLSGFHYLYNVERASNPNSGFSIDWSVHDTWSVHSEDQPIHLRLTMLTDVDELAIAEGDPPQNKPGNPRRLKYMVAHRSGDNLNSIFTSVLEPYKDNRFIASIEPVPVTLDGREVSDEEAKAVKVELKNGRSDYVISSLNEDVTYTIDGRIHFQGFFGVYMEQHGDPMYTYMHDGTYLGLSEETLIEADQGAVLGTVKDFTKELALQNELTVQMNLHGLDASSLVGEWIYVETDGERNGAYEIRSVTAIGTDEYLLNVGDQTFIRHYADASDFSKGYIYNLQVGARISIPLSYEEYNADYLVASTQAMIEQFKESGVLKGPLASQLTNAWHQVEHHLSKGSADQAVNHLERFLMHLHHEPLQDHISSQAKAMLNEGAQRLHKQLVG